MLIIVFGICSIVVFATIENVNTKIEGSTFIAILIIRNVFYVIRIAVLIKSEQLIRVAIKVLPSILVLTFSIVANTTI